MSRKRRRARWLIGASVGMVGAGAGHALADPFTVSYTDGGTWNTLFAQGFSPSLQPSPAPAGIAAGDTVLLDQFQFFKSGTPDSASNIRLAILNNIYTNLAGLTTSSSPVVGLSTNTIASTSALATGDAITFDFDNLALTYGGDYGAVFVNVGPNGELTPVLVSALHTDYVDVGGGDWHPESNYGTETQYQYTTSNFISTNEFGSFFSAFSYAGDANFRAFLLTPPAGGSTWNASGSGAWSAAGNWAGGVPNAAGASAMFGGAAASGATVTADVDVAVGSITFNNAGSYTIGGTHTVTLDATAGSAAIRVDNGSHAISAPLALADDTAITVTPAASTLTLAALAPSDATITKGGAGKLVVNNIRAGGLTIDGGVVQVAADSSATGTSRVVTLSIGTAGRLDLTKNKLITTTPAGTATTVSGNTRLYDGLQGLVQRAKNGDAWDGNGLTSSIAATEGGLTTIGIANGAQAKGGIGATETAVWGGQTITGSSILAMYTYAGDANLDGAITGDDYSAIDFGILFEGMDGYANGDFNYDGFVTGDDYSVIDLNILLQGPQIPTGGPVSASAAALSGVTAVPEPSACGFALLAAAALSTRRRRR